MSLTEFYQLIGIIESCPVFRSTLSNTTFQPIINWRIVYTPNIPILDELVRRTSTILKLQNGFGVNTSDELMDTLVRQNLFVGLEFHNLEVILFEEFFC